MAAPMWKTIPCKIAEIRLDLTLACGQSFRWKEYIPGIWTGVIGNAVWQLHQTDTELFYKVYRNVYDATREVRAANHIDIKYKIKTEPDLESVGSAKKRKNEKTKEHCIRKENIKNEPVKDIKPEVKREIGNFKITDCVQSLPAAHESNSVKHVIDSDDKILKDYFQLDINLEDMYKAWSKVDKNFADISKDFTGIRMLRQDPVECLFSFICSSNNHISRITSMVDKLAEHYGQKILDSSCVDGVEFYTFPKVEALAAEGVENHLRELGFGYRAKYIQESAKYIQENGGQEWLYSLRGMDYKDAKKNLIKLHGVGAKVADCVALMCLDQPGSIPVDTHVWQIAARDYMPKLKQAKSLNDKLYEEIGDYFRELWGPYAGWAHSVLFTADLRQFKDGKKESPKKTLKRKSKDNIKEDRKISKLK